jgi:hypothetical protein
MKLAFAPLGVGVAALMLAATAGAHPYTTWKEDGMSSDAHTHINSGEFVSSTTTTTTSTTVVPGTGYFTDEGVYVTSYGYYLRDGTFVQGQYVEGSVFAGGEVAGNTVITGGGIVGTYGYEEGWTSTNTVTSQVSRVGAQVSSQSNFDGRAVISTQIDGTKYRCWCAISANGERVPVYATAGNTRGYPKHHIGGGKTAFDLDGFRNNYWRVNWREADGGIQYGWVHAEDVACKRFIERNRSN